MAFHISSRYVDLYPVLQALGKKLALNTFVTHNTSDHNTGISASEWVLMSKHPNLGAYLYTEKALVFKTKRTENIWTDERHDLLAAVRW